MRCSPGLKMKHALRVCEKACPYSGNPLRGTIIISYTSGAFTAEVVDLESYVRWVTGGRGDAPKSVEEIAVRVATDMSAALEVPVRVSLRLLVNPGPQILRVSFRCN